MNSCHSCGGVIGRDCWNPQECAEITERMAIEQSQPDPAPSNANTSGLEVVAWLTTGGDVTRSEAYAKEQSVNDPDNYPSALVTAASAQARIAELRNAYCAAESDAMTLRKRATAAEARADRLAQSLEYIASLNCGSRPPETEEENNLGLCVAELQREARAALQQETQP